MNANYCLSPRRLCALCLASIGWAFSFGLGAPLASLCLRDLGCSDTVIGLNTAVYYLGIAVTAAAVPWLMNRLGQNCLTLGMVFTGLTVAVLPWSGSMTAWFVLRGLNGMAAAMSLIPIETLVNRHSPAKHRARNFGFYAFSIALGWALGNWVGLRMYESEPKLAFVFGGASALLAALIVLGWLPYPAEAQQERVSKAPLRFAGNFLSFGSAWSQGFLEGGMIAFLSVYLFYMGLNADRVGWISSGIMLGAILFQVPVAWLADRLGRTRVLLACYGATALGLICAPFCSDAAWLSFWLFVTGACSGAFYPLGLAILGERLPGPGLARANAWYLAINCAGSLIGPAITGFMMDLLGKRAVFAAAEMAVMMVVLVWLSLQVSLWRTSLDSGRASAKKPGIEAQAAA
jgi:MFS family permease